MITRWKVARYGMGVAACALQLAEPGTAFAQETADTTRRTSALCWRARVYPRCRSFLLTTIALEVPMFATRRVYHDAYLSEASTLFPGPRLTATAGFMVNRGREAYGIAGVWSAANEHARKGAEVRYRRWREGGTILDAGAGVVHVKGDATSFRRLSGSGLALAGEFGQPNFLALVTRYEAVRTSDGSLQHGGYGGVRVGSFGAPIAVALGVAAFIGLFALAYSGS